ncbi:ZIP family metal transporter [Haloplanus halobius]|uniref:ZIP family metal transporter n=1 Tax=Haloplanus halobius TaxID=2934938 RepID=UPI0020101443|nr:ZIP family metal transporter [Haloplanus sp. XH21]
MGLASNLLLVFTAGLLSAVTTGAGAFPFFVIDDVNRRVQVILWGLASGIMVSASTFGLVFEGLAAADGTADHFLIVGGLLAGATLVVVANRLLSGHEFDPREYAEADFRKLVLILGVLTVHSFPEGVAVGVSFAELNLAGGVEFGPFIVPLLAIFMTVAIAIHNIPEGLAISIPLRTVGISNWKIVWWAIFSSLPQPIGAVLAFAFVRVALEFLPAGFGFAAGAMIYLVGSEFIPEAIDIGTELPYGGYRELVVAFVVGVLLMAPLAVFG